MAYPGGVLLHTGLPNPGFRQVLRDYAGQWSRATIPIIVHLMVDQADHVHRMVRQLEEIEGVLGIELGFPPEAAPPFVAEAIQAAQGELPVIVARPLGGDLPTPLPSAISLSPPRGTLPGMDGGSIVQGRLYGPGLFPQVLHTVRAWCSLGVPVIAGGGVYHPHQAKVLLDAGALAVQLDLRLWRDPWPDEAWEQWLVSVRSRSSSAPR